MDYIGDYYKGCLGTLGHAIKKTPQLVTRHTDICKLLAEGRATSEPPLKTYQGGNDSTDS